MDQKDRNEWENSTGFGPLRQSLFNWYEFDRDASLLELNPGRGDLTELFCRRLRQVTVLAAEGTEAEFLKERFRDKENLRILRKKREEAGALRGMPANALPELSERFDYIVAVGTIEHAENPAEVIRGLRRLLKPDGILLLTAENRYGLKYFCGARDPHTGVVFDGVNGYLKGDGGQGRCLSRKELLKAAGDAGESSCHFYYPVPDSRMPQMIFSDRYQNGINTAERLVDYDYADSAMTGVEHRIFCEMIDSGALPFLANSFLMELGSAGRLSDIIYAVTTTDRGPEQGAATTIRENGLVKKRPLWQEGEDHLRRLHEYTEELAGRGVPVVRTKLERDPFGLVLTMPFIDEEGLSPVMSRLAESDPDRFRQIFDAIYRYILAASDPVPDADPEKGTVLKKAYLDLAPCNCFYQETDGSLLFYDQEFVMENCPAGFAMYRTLKYCYASARGMDRHVPFQDMLRRYGIKDSQTAEYEAMETEFIKGVRNTRQYGKLFQWATPDYGAIYRRMKWITALDEAKEPPAAEKPYRVGYVPGVFDLLHTGHLNLIERCKARCDHLIVGVLTDELVEYYKGRGTVIPYAERARMVGALKAVDQVVPVDFSNTNQLDAWDQLHYDCHFSGDDHIGHWTDVWEELKRRGSNMEFFPYTRGISSTQIRGEIENRKKQEESL